MRFPATPLLVAAILLAGFPPARLAAGDEPAPAGKSPPAAGAKIPKRIYQATRLEGAPPRIDGKLDDAAWSQGEWTGDFIQREPHEGRPGSQPTQLKILYDDKFIYAAMRAYDTELATQPRLRGKRDELIGDVVGVNFDSYFDKRTGFEFDLSSGGSKIDLLLKNDSWDTSWDAVWDGKVGLEAGAWTAEFRIPLSQLRYSNQPVQVWGLHSWRWINRLQEESDWQLIPMDSPGFVYSFGELHGIRNLPPSRRIELLPYARIKYATSTREPGNPYRRGTETDLEAGLDAKVGVTSNFTMDLTANPDFGQVEADPSEVNLTTYETFFEEKRPFFLEGKNIFEYGIDDDLVFYSRRIGHAPAFDPPTGGFKQTPTSTRILSAAKLTGKTPGGLSVGVLHSLSDREVARITENGVERRQTVEPMTNYYVARLQQDIDKGNTVVGGIVTATRRNLTADTPPFLPRNSYAAGLDYLHYWRDRTYYVDVRALASRVEGTPAAIRALQENPVHNYQRPDATHLGVETGARYLEGTGGKFAIGKGSNGRWRYHAEVQWRSPGLELNDVGYLRVADEINQALKLEYVDTQPAGRRRRYNVYLEQTNKFDFGGTAVAHETEFEGVITWMNNWSAWAHLEYDAESLDTRGLRGGPALRMPASASVWVGFQTDSSKTRQFKLDVGRAVACDGQSHYTEITPTFSARLFNIVNVAATISYSRDVEDLQYVATAASASRYVMGRMDQQTLATTVRFDINLTPELSLSYYGSPFVSTGRFSRFKVVTDPRAGRYQDRFRRLDALAAYEAAGNRYLVDDPGGSFSFANPDFSRRELRSNFVLRWEYRAGSTLYVVWTQNRANADLFRDFSAPSEYRRLFGAHPDNTFLVKLSYWFSI
jgi:hypothetical protein